MAGRKTEKLPLPPRVPPLSSSPTVQVCTDSASAVAKAVLLTRPSSSRAAAR